MDNDNLDKDNYEDTCKKPEQRRSYPSYVMVGLSSAVIGGLIMGAVFGSLDSLQMSGSKSPNITINADDNPNVAEAVAEKTMQSVVGITTTSFQQTNSLWNTQQLVEGVGSGIIVSGDGYILTNSHVISDGNAQSIKVMFIDGTEKEAVRIWSDASLDLAVLKVDAKSLIPAELGNSDEVKIGEPAIAIGNPLGLEFERTVTSGIISGLNRSVEVAQNNNAMTMEGLIQTDASINSGNSGGPLLNSSGQVIGINTLKISGGEVLGFAQPINLAKPVIDEITKTGKFEEAYMGITAGDALRYTKMAGMDLGVDYGAIVTAVAQGSPAEKAGLQAGDVITSINGDKIESFQGLKKALYKFKPGDSVNVTIVRDKQSIDLVLELGKAS